ncbi:carbohydrate kinase [Spirosoma luteolum]
MSALITCFGEMLWDLLPGTRQPGGAPMNLATSLHSLGLDTRLISCVGTDTPGTELLAFLSRRGLSTDFIQTTPHYPTGQARAAVSASQEVLYTVSQPAAWDYIEWSPALSSLVRRSDLFVYGSLTARNACSHDTLLALLADAPRTVFDLNLRQPYDDQDTIELLIRQADIAKLNEHELVELSGWYDYETDLEQAMRQVHARYGLDVLCVTLGNRGAALLDKRGFVQQPAMDVPVVDAIGGGDAFLAGLLHQLLAGAPARQTLAFACAAGAYVVSQQGANPPFTADTIRQFQCPR